MGDARTAAAEPAAARSYGPYPGLRYYDDAFTENFSGRDEEVGRFITLLGRSGVLILHGRSGCGKSSFLRAGVRPVVTLGAGGFDFNKEFSVIRSTGDPLQQFVDHVFDVIGHIADGNENYGRLYGRNPDREAFRAQFEAARAANEAGLLVGDIDLIVVTMAVLSDSIRIAPVFVIDQAEEVFTFDEAAGAQQLERIRNYFYLLGRVTKGETKCRVVVSLRTEYKGRFDDAMAVSAHDTERLNGFFLDDLDEAGLVEAIKKPTRRDHDGKPAPFEFELGVAESLAARLLAKDLVLPGGVLPTLQVTCRRLWRLGRDINPFWPFRIGERHLKQIGEIVAQIGEYVSESIEEACEDVGWWGDDFTAGDISDSVHHALAAKLVKREADGRAVTLKVPINVLISASIGNLDRGRNESDDLQERLNDKYRAAFKKLATDQFGVLREEGGDLMLGHDSVALALNRWDLLFNQTSMAMMRMSSHHAKGVLDLKSNDLFPAGEEPQPVELRVAQDFFWDRQIAIFAKEQRFAKRLGFSIETEPALDATQRGPSHPANWPALRRNFIAAGVESRQRAKDEKQGTRPPMLAVIASEWESFPGDYAMDETGSVPCDEEGRRLRPEAKQWSDLLVTNLFVGNALIGEVLPGSRIEQQLLTVEKHRQAREVNIADVVAAVRLSLEALIASDARVTAYSKGGADFLLNAARIVNMTHAVETYLKGSHPLTGAPNFVALDPERYQQSDPLADALLESVRSNDREQRPQFIVGSGMSRAIAVQAGYPIYFASDQLVALARSEMSERSAREAGHEGSAVTVRRNLAKNENDLAALIQGIVGHAVWQVSQPSGTWRNGRNRARMLRLASVGYFTIEQIRANPDRFVLHIYGFLKRITRDADYTDREARGLRLSRKAIRQAVQDSIEFFRFDDYPSELFDLDSPRAYWSDHGEADSRSIAGEVYFELVDLRRRTLDHFTRITLAVSTLRYDERYDPTSEGVRKAYAMKEIAWNNYRIMNFFDAERYMLRAADRFEALLESRVA